MMLEQDELTQVWQEAITLNVMLEVCIAIRSGNTPFRMIAADTLDETNELLSRVMDVLEDQGDTQRLIRIGELLKRR